jgi:hypothetical protein
VQQRLGSGADRKHRNLVAVKARLRLALKTASPAATQLPASVRPVFVTIGGVRAEVDCAGGAPGEVAGVIEININVRIPAVVRPQHRCAGCGSDRKRIQPNRCDHCPGSPESGAGTRDQIAPSAWSVFLGRHTSDNEQQTFHPVIRITGHHSSTNT